MVLTKVVASTHTRHQSALVCAFAVLAMTACTAGVTHAQVKENQPSSNAVLAAAGNKAVDSAAKLANYGKLPLSFAANQGQSDPRVRFTSKGNGYSLFLTDSEAVLTLSKVDGGVKAASLPARGLRKSPAKAALQTDLVRMQLAGGAPGIKVSGEERLPGAANYFLGNDPAKWRTGVPTYSKVKYAGVYPGVDLVYYGNQRQLEYDFVVAPGADPEQVKLHFAGAKLSLNAHGDLMMTGKHGKFAFEKPVVYQLKSGSTTEREKVNGKFNLLAANTVGFSLGGYDKSRAVVIDPILAYSTYLGGSDTDRGLALAIDGSGDAYVTGEAASTDFPVTYGSFQTTKRSNAYDVFITKLNSTGTTLVYSTYLGGSDGRNNSGNR